MAFTNSPLVTYTKISPNRTENRNHAIDTITIHCVVGQCSVQTLGEIFAPTSRQASSNYGVGYEGSIGMYVEEKDRSWCSSSRENDHRAITIEVASDNFHPYAVTQAAYEATIELVADVCKRNGITKLVWSTNKNDRVNHVNGCNMTVHRDFFATNCPGEYLYDRMGDIANRVNILIGATEDEPEPAPEGAVSEGDVVDFLGGAHYSSSDASVPAAGNLKGGRAKVTRIYAGKHPYHLIHVDDTCAVYGWVDANQIKQLQETEVPTKYKVGDIVQFNGGAHYSSANGDSPAASSLKAGPAKVTQVFAGKHPYHVIHTDSQSTVYGWVDEDSLSTIESNKETFAVGDMAKIKKGAKSYSGTTLASFVYDNIYRIDDLNGDRAVLDKSGICTPVNTADLTKVSGSTTTSTSTAIKVGDRVTVKSGAKTYTGESLASFVYRTTYDVLQVSGDRVVIGLNDATTAAMKVSDLTKVG